MAIHGNKAKTSRVVHARAPTLSSRLSQQSSRLPMSAPLATPRITGLTLQAIRRRHFEQNPLCVHCQAKGRVVAAIELDHIIPLWKGGADSAENRQGLCGDCHALKTSSEQRERYGVS
jgi:5-methylcytosine-specific restriction protein A